MLNFSRGSSTSKMRVDGSFTKTNSQAFDAFWIIYTLEQHFGSSSKDCCWRYTSLPHLKVRFDQISRVLNLLVHLFSQSCQGLPCVNSGTLHLLWSHSVPAALSPLEPPQEHSTHPRSREAQGQQILPRWLGARISCETEFSFE